MALEAHGPACLNKLRINGKRKAAKTGITGFCALNPMGSTSSYLDLMPPEFFIAGVVAESLVTGEEFRDMWEAYRLQSISAEVSDHCQLSERYEIDDEALDKLANQTRSWLKQHETELLTIAEQLNLRGTFTAPSTVVPPW